MPAKMNEASGSPTGSILAGATVDTSQRNKASVSISLESGSVDAQGWVNEELLGQLSRLANQQGLEAKMAIPGLVRALESKLSLYEAGEGGHLTAEGKLVHEKDSQSVWRAVVYRSDVPGRKSAKGMVAECTQTLLFSPIAVTEAANDQTDEAEAEVASGETVKRKVGRPANPNLSEERRRQIFHGACEVISHKGYAATSIRQIAAAAKIPIPTMYQYIDSKEDILYMITSESMSGIFSYFNEHLQGEGKANDKLVEAVEAYVKYVSKNRKYINLVYSETRALNAENRDKIFGVERDFTNLWQDIIVQGIESGEFNKEIDPHLAANMIYFFCNVWSLRYWTIEDYSEKQVIDALLRFILGGLKK